MKIKLSSLLIAFLICAGSIAQQRYLDEVFSSVDVTSDVKYGENYSIQTQSPVLTDLNMDVYEPTGDTVTNRPLIILAHAGSFLPKGQTTNGLPLGVKTDSCMIEMCTQFAKRGWVAASIDYRLGWNPISSDPDVRAGTIIQAVYRAMQDMKACVRYFKKEQATYNIDTTKITVGGSNSGGYMALAYVSLNDTSEIQLLKFTHSSTFQYYIDQSMLGDFDGKGGSSSLNIYNHPGYSSDVQLALNLGGAIGDTTWQNAGEVPIISFHGEEDGLTPYKTGVVIVAATMQSVVEVSGSHDLSRYATALGNQNLSDGFFSDPYSTVAATRTSHKGLFPFSGVDNGFEPWGWYDPNDPAAVGTGGGSPANPKANPTKGRLYIDTIMGYFCPRAVQVLGLPGSTVGVDEALNDDFIQIFPNPTANFINVKSSETIKSIIVTDITGKTVKRIDNVNSKSYVLERNDNMYKGLYLMTIKTNSETTTKRVVFE